MWSYDTRYIAIIYPEGGSNNWSFGENSVNLTYTVTKNAPEDSQISGSLRITGSGIAAGRNYVGDYIGSFQDGIVIYVSQFSKYYFLSETAYSAGITFVSNPAPLIVCFTSGTSIDTIFGSKSVENLIPGDLIRTKDHGYQELRWIGKKTLSELDLFLNPHLLPIRISPGALGVNTPTSDLTISPHHRILLRSEVISSLLGQGEVLVAAKKLLGTPGIDIVTDLTEVTYIHLLFDRHEIVYANGAETETLFTGPEALKAIPKESRREVEKLFPELINENYRAKPARVLPSGKALKKALAAHKNIQMLLVGR